MAGGFGKAGSGGVRRTALERFALLEALGDYWDGVSARPREVVVRFGESSLILLRLDDVPIAHWALASLRRLDGSEPGEILLTPDGDPDADERLVVRDPTMIEAIEAVCTELDGRPSPARGALRLGLWTVGALAVVAAATFAAVPWASDRLAAMIPADQEVRLGEDVRRRALDLAAGGAARLCTAPDGLRALQALQDRLLAEADLPVPVSVLVVRSAQADAFAAPGGRIALFSGLIDRAGGPEEVAAVLAHELGHVARRDPIRAALEHAGAGGVFALAFGAEPGADLASAAASSLVSSGYSPAAEAEADAYAFALLSRAGLPASAFAEVMERPEAGSGVLSRHLASPPDAAARAAAARAADDIPGAWVPALEDDRWLALRDICQG